MGVRSRLSSMIKVFGNAEPPQIAAGEAAAGMTPAKPFSPGEPIGPYDGFSRHPRTHNFVTGYNISARPRSNERVPFDTLQGLIEAYDVASMAIWHRIDSLRALEWSLVAADGFEGDITEAVATGMSVLDSPDHGESDFSSWLAAYAYDILAYDAGTLYRIRNRADQVIGLRCVDGKTVAPLLDYWGNVPAYPAEAYVQYVNGLPWNWLTTRDLIYKPFRKRPSSPYGQAPLETILLNANTDLRFQAYFLQRFTSGNIPAAFAAAPETWTPQQIESFQEYWDAFILGDQAVKSQIKWIPGGSRIEFTNEREFSDAFSLHLMRKTLAAYHVVPSDMGFTQEINKSSGETQSDVQHRVGDVPLAKHISRIITGFLQNDLHLPLKHAFDFGEEQDDRLQTAQADDLYVKMGAIGASEIRQLRYGLIEPGKYTVPRFVFSTRSGPIPLSSLDAVAGPIDPATGAPEPGTSPIRDAFRAVEGVTPEPPLNSPPLAEQIYGVTAADDPQAVGSLSQDVAKDGPVATAGISADTGLYSYDLAGGNSDDEEEDEDEGIAKEMAMFRRHAKQCRRPGRRWKDFQFTAVDPGEAQRLNKAGRASVLAKAATAGNVAERSGMISLDLPDGTLASLSGGVTDHHITVVYLGPDVDDSALAYAARRAQAAAAAVPGPLSGIIAGTGSFPPSAGSDGKVPVWAGVAVPGIDALRAELADLSASEHTEYRPHVTLAYRDEGDPLPGPVPPTPVVFTHLAVHRKGSSTVRIPLGPGPVAKAGANPKAPSPAKGDGPHWPGWDHDERSANYWSPILLGALTGILTAGGARLLAAGFLAAQPEQGPDADRKTLIAEAVAYLLAQRLDIAGPVADRLAGVYADGVLIGAASAQAVVDGTKTDLGGWAPGDTGTAETLISERGQSATLDKLVDGASSTADGIADSRINAMGRALADATLNGATESEAGQAIQDALASESAADAIAITEISTASGAGALATYLANGIAKLRWITEGDRRVCPRCLANQAAGAVPAGQPFPSGDTSPPIHPGDRCGILPA